MKYMTVSKFRKDLFALLETALKGEPVEFVHKGVTFKVVPERYDDPLARLTALQVVNPSKPDLESASRELMDEMQVQWEDDWKAL